MKRTFRKQILKVSIRFIRPVGQSMLQEDFTSDSGNSCTSPLYPTPIILLLRFYRSKANSFSPCYRDSINESSAELRALKGILAYFFIFYCDFFFVRKNMCRIGNTRARACVCVHRYTQTHIHIQRHRKTHTQEST